MPKRSIDSKIRKSYSFSKLSFRQRDLWHGLIEVVDDQGRMPAEPAFIRSMVWAYDDILLDEVQKDLQALINEEMIVIYEKKGALYMQIINWWKYQSSANWMGASNYPAPDGWVDRCRYHVKGNKIATENWDKQGGFTKQDSNLDSNLDRRLPSAKPCSDVNDDVNDDVNVNGDDDVDVDASAQNSSDNPEKKEKDEKSLFSELSNTFIEYSGLPEMIKNAKTCSEGINELINLGATPDILAEAITDLNNKGYKIISPGSCVKACAIVMGRKNGKRAGPESNEDAYRRYIKGEYADVGVHIQK